MKGNAKPRDAFGLKIVTLVAAGIPIESARFIHRQLSKLENYWIRILIYAALLLLSVLWLVFGRFLFEKRFQESSLGVRAGFYYLTYLISALPFFLLFTHFVREKTEELFTGKSGKRLPSELRMRSERYDAGASRTFLGASLRTGKSVYLTNDQRLMHLLAVGSTGTGKTESVLLPMLAHDIAHKRGSVIIDGKGDLELFERIHYIVKKKKRLDDFFFFSLAHPEKSNTYNPLLHGNATELKDKIIGSMPWSEEFYRRVAEQATLTLLNAILQNKRKAKFRDLHMYLTDLDALGGLVKETRVMSLRKDLQKMENEFRQNPKFLSGLMADLYLTSRSDFSKLLDAAQPEIDLRRVYEENKICYFQLNLQAYGDTGKRLGRMVVQDLKTVSSHVQTTRREASRIFFPIHIDDAASFLGVNFIDFINKARASRFAISLYLQSLGDLWQRGEPSFQQQILENTNIKIILRQDDPISVEKLSKVGGTRKTVISTYQTEEKFLGRGFTGTGSVREGQAFRIEPDLIRELLRGEAAVIWKNPSLYTDYVKLDFFGCPQDQGEFKPIHPKPKEEEKEPPAPEPGELSEDVQNPCERINKIKSSPRK